MPNVNVIVAPETLISVIARSEAAPFHQLVLGFVAGPQVTYVGAFHRSVESP